MYIYRRFLKLTFPGANFAEMSVTLFLAKSESPKHKNIFESWYICIMHHFHPFLRTFSYLMQDFLFFCLHQAILGAPNTFVWVSNKGTEIEIDNFCFYVLRRMTTEQRIKEIQSRIRGLVIAWGADEIPQFTCILPTCSGCSDIISATLRHLKVECIFLCN